MTRSEHQRTVEEAHRQLRPYEQELDRLVDEAQAWLDRLRIVQAKTESGELRHGRRTS